MPVHEYNSPSSERIDPKQLLLSGQQMQQAAEEVEKLAECQEKSSVNRKGHGRRRLPDNLACHRNEHGIDPFIYLRNVLANIGSTPLSQLDQFLPDRWRDERIKEMAAG